MFIEAFFVIVKNWKQPRCPSTGEWINKSWDIYAMDYQSAMKRNVVLIHAAMDESQNNK